MHRSFKFLKCVIDAITECVAVIDSDGVVVFVNETWKRFGRENGGSGARNSVGVNYLQVCEQAAAGGDEVAEKTLEGIRALIDGRLESFHQEYPCHTPDQKRWFLLKVSPFELSGVRYCILSHTDITDRKLMEEDVRFLSNTDQLTGIANRRAFDEFLSTEWERAIRDALPITLALIDIDHFKSINDARGHQAGDQCLKRIAELLTRYARRPGDLCARYGGDEFAIVHSGMTLAQSVPLLRQMLEEVRRLDIGGHRGSALPLLTLSIGVHSVVPRRGSKTTQLIKAADDCLYEAKAGGRNQLCTPASSRSSLTVGAG